MATTNDPSGQRAPGAASSHLSSSASLLFRGVTWTLPDGQPLWSQPLDVALGAGTTGIVGANGAGKSVFLQLLLGQLQPATGAVLRRARLHAVAQEVQGAPGTTVADLSGLAPVLGALARLDAGRGLPDDLLLADGQWDLPARWQRALQALGLDRLPPQGDAGRLSGGECMRVALAGAFVSDAQVLVLDEPTNQLDRVARRWLLDRLAARQGGVVVASHDRELLGVAGAIVELSPTGLRRYGGSWTLYAAQRDQERSAAQAALEHARAERERGRKALQRDHEAQQRRAAQGRRVARTANLAPILLGRMRNNAEAHAGREHERQQEARGRLDAAVWEAARQAPQQAPVALALPESAVPAGRQVLALEQVRPPFAPPGLPAMEGVWSGPVRIAITGPNGCGKSTLLRLVAGQLAPVAGRVVRGVRAAWLDQHNAGLLPPQASVLQRLAELGASLPESTLRTRLAQLGLDADRVQRPAGALSGGERIKAALACALWAREPAQMLLLDEPTNHLDLASVQALQAALQGFTGALLVVSHDLHFLQALQPTLVWAWRRQGWQLDAPASVLAV
jgi:ATPase subunit of ABC transporter with duplicated ATPase domains